MSDRSDAQAVLFTGVSAGTRRANDGGTSTSEAVASRRGLRSRRTSTSSGRLWAARPGWPRTPTPISCHIRAGCQATDSRVPLLDASVLEAVLVVELAWIVGTSPEPDIVRAELFRLLGSFAEHTTHVVQRSTDDAVEFEIATGTTAGESPYLPHGHLVRAASRRNRDLRIVESQAVNLVAE